MMCTKKVSNRIAVIGGGAAGMFAACVAAENGSEVFLYEKNDFLGKKLAITGKGRCNLTNNCDVREFISNVPTGGKFLYSAINKFTPQDTMTFFENSGLPLKTERGNRVFPVSDKAVDVVFTLKKLLKEFNVHTVKAKVTGIESENGQVCRILTQSGKYDFCKVILATGGISYPLTGSTGDGYKFASKLGHNIVPPKPSLVPLETVGDSAKNMQGLSLKNIRIRITDNKNGKDVYDDFGEMLFTHFGVSGPVILSASAYLKDISSDRYELHIDLKPALSDEELDKRVLSDFEKYKNKDFVNALSDLLPQKIIREVINRSGISERIKVNSIDKKSRQSLVNTIKDFRLTIKGTRPVSEAIITSGGVSLDEINPSTMESKIVKGLYFAGEIIDADAYTGGFNLQIAFSTAYCAATSASNDG